MIISRSIEECLDTHLHPELDAVYTGDWSVYEGVCDDLRRTSKTGFKLVYRAFHTPPTLKNKPAIASRVR